MAKKKNRPEKVFENRPAPAVSARMLAGVSVRGWKVIGTGAGVVVLGFIVLSMTDPAGQNWASTLSPFLLLGGYAAIGAGIITPDKKTTAPDGDRKTEDQNS